MVDYVLLLNQTKFVYTLGHKGMVRMAKNIENYFWTNRKKLPPQEKLARLLCWVRPHA